MNDRDAHELFLLRLTDSLNKQPDIEHVHAELSARLNDYLRLSGLIYWHAQPTVITFCDATLADPSAGPAPQSIERLRVLLEPGTAVISDTAKNSLLPATTRIALHNRNIQSCLSVTLSKEGHEVAWLLACDSQPRNWTAAEIGLVENIVGRVWLVVKRVLWCEHHAGTQAETSRLRVLMESIPQLLWRSSNLGRWTWVSPQWTQCTGQSREDSYGWGWIDRVHPDDRVTVRRSWSAARALQKLSVEFRIWHAHSASYRWFLNEAAPLRNDNETTIEWFGTSTDVHRMRELQNRQKALIAELQHRARNLTTMVLTTAERTARSSQGLNDFLDKYRHAIGALTRVQRVLSRVDAGGSITFDEILEAELTACGVTNKEPDQVKLEGRKGINLQPSSVQTLSLAIHELATNAAKYGALKQPSALLTVRWQEELADDHDEVWLVIDWRERGVSMPAIAQQAPQSGQGRKLIEDALPYEFGARTTYKVLPDGIHCVIALPNQSSSQSSGIEWTDAVR